jgi:hypothetical protein
MTIKNTAGKAEAQLGAVQETLFIPLGKMFVTLSLFTVTGPAQP